MKTAVRGITLGLTKNELQVLTEAIELAMKHSKTLRDDPFLRILIHRIATAVFQHSLDDEFEKKDS